MTEEALDERKYALTRVVAGDYLLPSNDAQTIWRIHRYIEGPSTGIDHLSRDRMVWGVWKWIGANTTEGTCVDTTDWDRWEAWDLSMYATRSEAIAAALGST